MRTPTTPEAVADLFEKRCAYWADALGLDGWKLEFTRQKLDGWFAHVEAFWQYRLARFVIDADDAFAKAPHEPAALTDWVDELSCHEVVHCLLAPMADCLDAHTEQAGPAAAKIGDLLHESVTDSITAAVRGLVKPG